MGAKAPHAGPELDMLFTVYAPHGPSRGPLVSMLFLGLARKGVWGTTFHDFYRFYVTFGAPFSTTWAPLRVPFFIVFFKSVF